VDLDSDTYQERTRQVNELSPGVLQTSSHLRWGAEIAGLDTNGRSGKGGHCSTGQWRGQL